MAKRPWTVGPRTAAHRSWLLALPLVLVSSASAMGAGELRVATLNVGLSDFGEDVRTWPERAEVLARLVQELQLDVLALQEIWEIDADGVRPEFREYLASLGVARGRSKLEHLRKSLPDGLAIASELIPSSEDGELIPGLTWGLAVVSRHPIAGSERWRLTPDVEDRYPRIVQQTRIDVGTGLELINAHLSAESGRSREVAAGELLAGIDPLWTVLAGDLNAVPSETPVERLRERLRDLWLSAVERRLFVGGARQVPTGAFGRFVERARIDYLMAGARWKATVCETHVDSLAPTPLSDHPLVVCSISAVERGAVTAD